jgi:hypothetical protein
MRRQAREPRKRHSLLSNVPHPHSPAGRYFDYWSSLGVPHPGSPAGRYFDDPASIVLLAGWPQQTRHGAGAPPTALQQQDSRKLTEGEIKLAKSVFGDKINCDKVTVHHKRFIFFQPKDRLMTPNGNIYAAPNGTNYSEDYATIAEPQYGAGELVYSQAEFIHEMTHVWQHQTGMSVELRGIIERNYEYDLKTLGQKDFKRYGIEEQAQMVEDYYLLLKGGAIYRDGKEVKNPPALKLYEQVLKPYFPLSK